LLPRKVCKSDAYSFRANIVPCISLMESWDQTNTSENKLSSRYHRTEDYGRIDWCWRKCKVTDRKLINRAF
jgi:hypothetical protein